MTKKYAITIGGCYNLYDTYEIARERLTWLENATGMKGTIREILCGRA